MPRSWDSRSRLHQSSSDVDEFFALFSIEAGALAGHPTAGRRVGMFGPNATFTPAHLTTDGLNVFNAAVEWAIPEPATMALLAF
ncbi:MAG: hypothetical protein GWP16_05015, partial [Nitrospirae bacterium]|nr:hypothetical protein [Nitrospirota bacterium]